MTRLIRSCSGSGATSPLSDLRRTASLPATERAQVLRSFCGHGRRSFSCQPHLVMHRQDFYAEDADFMLRPQSPVRMHVNVEPFMQPGDVTHRPFLWAGA